MIYNDIQKYPEEVRNVLEVLNSQDIEYQVRILDAPAHHAKEAAELLGCPLGAVVKSLIFTTKDQENFVLVLVSGQNRADKKKLEEIIGQPITPAGHDKVFAFTGYPVGAVPPFGLRSDFPVIIDEDLLEYQNVWSSAGSEYVLMEIQSSLLGKITGGKVCTIKKS